MLFRGDKDVLVRLCVRQLGALKEKVLLVVGVKGSLRRKRRGRIFTGDIVITLKGCEQPIEKFSTGIGQNKLL